MEATKSWFGALAIAVLAVACGREPEVGGDASTAAVAETTVALEQRTVPLQLTVDDRGAAQPRPGLAAELAQDVAVTSGRAEVQRAERPDGPAATLLVQGSEPVELRWRGPFETHRLASLELLLRSDVAVQVNLAPELILGTGRLELQPQSLELQPGAIARASFAIPVLPPAQSEVAAVRLGFACGPRGVELLAMSMPWRAPQPWDRERRSSATVEFDGDARPALLLRSGDVARARVRATPAGGTLTFAYGRSQRSPGQSAAPQLVVWVGDRRTTLELTEAERWSTAALPIPPSDPNRPSQGGDGHDFDVRFEVQAETGEVYAALAEPALVPAQDTRPDVVLVTSDTHRGDHLGVSGSAVGARTPALDALAARGVYYEDCFATSHVTLPSHAAIFTGTSPRDTGVVDNLTMLSTDAPTLAEAFRDAGYLTCAVTSLNLLGDEESGFGQGFVRRNVPAATRTGDETVSVALAWLEAAGPRPLFLWVHVADAHSPYEPPAAFLAPYWPADGGDAFDPARPPDEHAPSWLADVRDLDYVRALYRGEVSFLDAQLARLLDQPRVHAAVVAVTADHGECLGAHGFYWRHKGLYTDTLRVPLILAWPGDPAGTRIGEPVGHLDLGRTLLDLAGVEAAFPGRDLAGTPGAGERAPADRFAIATGRRSASITRDGMHLIQFLREPHRVELYDLRSDPGCATDLSETRHDEARELRTALLAWLAAAAEGGRGRWAAGRQSDAGKLESLAALGYADQVDDTETGSLRLPPDCPCASCRSFR